MNIQELQTVVGLEAICLALIVVIIVSSFKRWKSATVIASALASAIFFVAWTPVMALGSVLVYTPASILLWVEFGKDVQKRSSRVRYTRTIAWSVLAIGVATLILKNVYNIFIYLGY